MKKFYLTGLYVILAAFFMASCSHSKASGNYKLYVGTNDRETYKIEIPIEEQKSILLEIITRHTDGVTIYETDGYWKDEKNNLTVEKTFVCEFMGITLDVVKKISADVLVELNQNSVLLLEETQKVQFLSRDTLLN
ncbi:MAG: DUF3574 domain-containing protein [Treponema sp.]|nr:DUF3574 domain-containing protein [Candidatus Treponema equifaecale]